MVFSCGITIIYVGFISPWWASHMLLQLHPLVKIREDDQKNHGIFGGFVGSPNATATTYPEIAVKLHIMINEINHFWDQTWDSILYILYYYHHSLLLGK